MRPWLRLDAAALAVAILTTAAAAQADSMDPALGRLVVDTSCRTDGAVGTDVAQGRGEFYDPLAGFARCQRNDAAFAKLVAQLGFALAPTASHAARTTGFGGYKVGVEMAYTTIDSDADYWKRGTEGPTSKSQNLASIVNDSPDDVLQLYSVRLAKGFPFGLELGAGFGYLANTSIVSGGGDVRFALFEGFRESVPGYLPDVGVGGGVRTITGTSELKLTVASFDAQLSKPIHIAGTVIIQPHVGYQWIRIFGDSGLIDLTPNTDALTTCRYQGDNTPANPDTGKQNAAGQNLYDGQPVCAGSSADFNNNTVFAPVRLTRHRINFGAQVRFQMLYLSLHALTDVVKASDANDQTYTISNPAAGTSREVNLYADDPRTEGDDEVGRQWTFSIELGASF
jgi:hypothetical protein